MCLLSDLTIPLLIIFINFHIGETSNIQIYKAAIFIIAKIGNILNVHHWGSDF